MSRSSRGRVLWPAAGVLVLLIAMVRLVPIDLRRANDLSLEVQDRAGELLNAAVSHDGFWRLRTGLPDVSPAYLSLLLRQEDRRFYAHPGIDPLALLRAAAQFAAHGRVVSGGSTLTMQVARLLHPHRHTLAGKLRDMATALMLEARLSKPEILSLYLTLAPFGGNIEGVRAASLIYFGHEPATLTAQEAALLVALPQSPARRRPDRHPGTAEAASARVLAGAGIAGGVWRFTGRHDLPRSAPHLAARLRLAGLCGPVRTTLDAKLQRALETLARRETAWFRTGVEAAALVVRNADRAVLAYLGGTDWQGRSGMIDMVHAVRSPGSALKPFIYGLALGDGLIRPDTLIEDARLRIADYAPQDFDRAFHGTVPAAEALQQSYNLPAVTLLDWLGAPRVAAVLRDAGARLAIPGGGPATLPLALGGVGMDLWGLTSLYAGLGSEGVVRPLRLLPGDATGPGIALMTARAANDVTAILRAAPPPTGLSDASLGTIAYKTGTSFGFRDAWAFGTAPGTTVGVWVGRADGTPRPGAFARATAAPLLFRIFGLLPEEIAPAQRAISPAAAIAPALRRLAGRDRRLLQPDYPHIIYPPPGATLALQPGRTLALEAAGGRPPYRWTINGQPLPQSPLGENPAWQPDGPGFAHLTLTDDADHSTEETLSLR